jgi:hypothetical protein
MFNRRRQPSRGGTSRMTRECQVRSCERLGVKFPGSTRQKPKLPHRNSNGWFTSINGHNVGEFYLRCRPAELLAVMRGQRLRRRKGAGLLQPVHGSIRRPVPCGHCAH